MDSTLAQMAEKFAITELMSRYCDRIDAKDPAGAAACFTEGGVGDYWGEETGRAAITARLTGILARFQATSHHLTNVLIELNGERASAMSYVYAFHRKAADSSAMHVWGRWVDRLEKVDGQWLFAHRRVALVGSENRDGGDFDHPGHPGRLP